MSDSRPKSFAEKIMEKSGWQSGQGLGKFSQGRVEPIRTETRDERMGLGYVPVHPTITKRTHTIDRNRFIPHKQEPKWLISQVPYEPHTVFNTPDRWIGPSDEAIDYNLFCDVDLVNKLMQAKVWFTFLGHYNHSLRVGIEFVVGSSSHRYLILIHRVAWIIFRPRNFV
jgi:hypothetical protein